MNATVQKRSVSLPVYLAERLTATLGRREISGFIARAVEEKLLRDLNEEDTIEAFLTLRDQLPKISRKAIRLAIEKGRT